MLWNSGQCLDDIFLYKSAGGQLIRYHRNVRSTHNKLRQLPTLHAAQTSSVHPGISQWWSADSVLAVTVKQIQIQCIIDATDIQHEGKVKQFKTILWAWTISLLYILTSYDILFWVAFSSDYGKHNWNAALGHSRSPMIMGGLALQNGPGKLGRPALSAVA